MAAQLAALLLVQQGIILGKTVFIIGHVRTLKDRTVQFNLLFSVAMTPLNCPDVILVFCCFCHLRAAVNLVFSSSGWMYSRQQIHQLFVLLQVFMRRLDEDVLHCCLCP